MSTLLWGAAPPPPAAVEQTAARGELGRLVGKAEYTGDSVGCGVNVVALGLAVGAGGPAFGFETVTRILVAAGLLLCLALVVVGRAAGSFWPFGIAAGLVLLSWPAWAAPDSVVAGVYVTLVALSIVGLGSVVLLGVGRSRHFYVYERGLVAPRGGSPWSVSRQPIACRWADTSLVGWSQFQDSPVDTDYVLVNPDRTRAFLPRPLEIGLRRQGHLLHRRL